MENQKWKHKDYSKSLHSPQKEDYAFCRGDRVLKLVNGTEEFGWVRWIGKYGSEDLIGVEFDNPVGKDNHGSNGTFLFEAIPHHAWVLPSSCLMLAEDYFESYQLTSNNRKHSKNDVNVLGNDMTSLSPFHKMAFEKLSSGTSQKALSVKNSSNKVGNNCNKENWDLPHSSHIPSKNLLGTNKETLNDVRNKVPRARGKSYTKVTTLLDEKNMSSLPSSIPSSISPTSKKTSRPSTLLLSERDILPPPPISISGGGIIGGSDVEDLDSPLGSPNPLSHLSMHGIDQVEVLSDDGDDCYFDTPKNTNKEDEDLGIGSLVEVILHDSICKQSWKPLFGVIRWIGYTSNDKKHDRKIAGIEMEDADDGVCDGTLKGKRYFICLPRKGLFVSLKLCVKDSRFLESFSKNPKASLAFGSTDCQPVTGSIPPLSTFEDAKTMFGRNKGIQGHQNSCYLDATLFSMFAFTSVFDSLLFRPPSPNDIDEYINVQRVLREEIVNPLRKNKYVRADRIMKLRTMLDPLSSVKGLTTEEKDPEEFLQSLLAQILRADPFLQLSSGQEAYHYQLFVDKDDKLNLPSVQTLFGQSFLTSDIKLKQIPSCLIIQMPRFGKDYKMYPRILPSMVLDITDVIEDSPRQCIICGKLAEYECRECYDQCGSELESIAFCIKCMEKVHSHKKRDSHTANRSLKIPPEFQMLADHCGTIPRVYMELFAVVCIETSHYVTFTRCGSGPEATWCFFDSMADRKGEQHGYNIPAVIECTDLMQWVGEEGSQMLHTVTDNKALPDLPRRLLCDAYMCFYQSPSIMMYR